MNRESIIAEFTTDIKKFKKMAYNIAGAQDADDLFQTCSLMLLEFSEDRLISYYNPAQGLKPFFLRMLCNQYRSNTSKFHKDYRKQEKDLQKKTEDILINAPQSEEEIDDAYFENIESVCRQIYQEAGSPEAAALLKTVWELYIETGSLRKAGKALPECYKNIVSIKYIHEIVKKFQTAIKNKLSEDY